MHELALIGFGEAGQAFAGADGWKGRARAYDKLTDDPAARAGKLADCQRAGVECADSLAAALRGRRLVLSLVTADQASAVAERAASAIAPGALYCDMNSVAPATKRRAEAAIAASGAHYVDVAIMAPVHPARLAVPLLLSGARAQSAAELLAGLGFSSVRAVGATVGQASAIKMIRSVMVKGMEALSAECALAASAAGVLDEVVASLDASSPGAGWASRFDYNLDRMLVHGLRRAAEMEEVVRTLDGLGTGSMMTRGTVERQRALGALQARPPAGLEAKLALILDRKAAAA